LQLSATKHFVIPAFSNH